VKPARPSTNPRSCAEKLADALNQGGVALGFEAPMFVPLRNDPKELLMARSGESGKGLASRPFSAGAGPMAIATALVVVPYVLCRLREKAPQAIASFDWRTWQPGSQRLLLFEAFVTNQQKTTTNRHIEDARIAVAAFQRGMNDPPGFRVQSSRRNALAFLRP
jgi:hypothetical protein